MGLRNPVHQFFHEARLLLSGRHADWKKELQELGQFKEKYSRYDFLTPQTAPERVIFVDAENPFKLEHLPFIRAKGGKWLGLHDRFVDLKYAMLRVFKEDGGGENALYSVQLLRTYTQDLNRAISIEKEQAYRKDGRVYGNRYDFQPVWDEAKAALREGDQSPLAERLLKQRLEAVDEPVYSHLGGFREIYPLGSVVFIRKDDVLALVNRLSRAEPVLRPKDITPQPAGVGMIPGM